MRVFPFFFFFFRFLSTFSEVILCRLMVPLGNLNGCVGIILFSMFLAMNVIAHIRLGITI